jgi:hypothetical protein
MKRFRIKDYSYLKYIGIVLVLAAVFNFGSGLNLGATTGFFINKEAIPDKKIIDITLQSEEVKEFLSGRDFEVVVNHITPEEKEQLKQEFPSLYSGLPDNTLYEVIYYSGTEKILVITDSEKILRTFSR